MVGGGGGGGEGKVGNDGSSVYQDAQTLGTQAKKLRVSKVERCTVQCTCTVHTRTRVERFA